MKFTILFAIVSAVVVSIDTQLVFYPSFARVPSFLTRLPGFDFSKYDNAYMSFDNDDQEIITSYGDAEGRQKTFSAEVGMAEGRQGDDLLGTVGGDLNLNSVPNPFFDFRKDYYRPRSKTIVVPPVCVACKCLVGSKSCSDAGGKQWISGECSADPTLAHAVGAECAYAAPSSLSACDSTCVKSCLATVAAVAPLLTQCTPIDALNKKQCGTPCQDLARGTIVKCNSAYPDAVSNIPSPCSNHYHRYRRQLNNSLPATEASSQAPEIQSSHESPSDRRGRAIKFAFPVNPRLNVNPVTNFVRGMVTATYVAADGVCLPGDLASAPMCN